jgi:hypothetical protein
MRALGVPRPVSDPEGEPVFGCDHPVRLQEREREREREKEREGEGEGEGREGNAERGFPPAESAVLRPLL